MPPSGTGYSAQASLSGPFGELGLPLRLSHPPAGGDESLPPVKQQRTYVKKARNQKGPQLCQCDPVLQRRTRQWRGGQLGGQGSSHGLNEGGPQNTEVTGPPLTETSSPSPRINRGTTPEDEVENEEEGARTILRRAHLALSRPS